MRELTTEEIGFVTGGHCEDSGSSGGQSGGSEGNDIGGIKDSGSLGEDLINIYEGLVEVTSHVIERVANAFKD